MGEDCSELLAEQRRNIRAVAQLHWLLRMERRNSRALFAELAVAQEKLLAYEVSN